MFFKKSSCYRCGRRIGKNYSFCPFCGANLRERARTDMDFSQMRMPFPFGRIFNQLTKELAREMNKLNDPEEQEDKKMHRKGISISISNISGEPKVKIGNLGMPELRKRKARHVRRFSKEDVDRYAKLPREEAKTSVKRLAQGIIYELALPDVKDVKDIFVNKLQNSIEVKAFGNKKAYFKLIPVDMDVKGYSFKDGKLILELKE